MVWNTDSIRDFTKKSFLIQQIYENNIDIAMLQEPLLTNEDKFYIKNYKIYRSNSTSRKGVSILISNSLDCDTYKTIEDLKGRYLQVKMKNEYNEIFLGAAYVEPTEQNNFDILPKNIIESNIFSGDLNKMNSGLIIIENVYQIKNIGELVEKIKVPKKISGHPILIFQRELPFKKADETCAKNVINEEIADKNLQELKKILIDINLSYKPIIQGKFRQNKN